MFTIHKIFLIVVIVLEANGSPFFEGISFQKGFEFKIKPWERKPFEFIKEKLTPIGVFGRKLAVHKRSLEEFLPKPPENGARPVAPVFEELEEIQNIGPQPLFVLPHHLKPPLLPASVPVELPKPPPPPPVSAPKQPPPPLPVPLPIIVTDEPPPKPPVPPISTNMVIIQPTTLIKNHEHLKPGLYTHISRVEAVKEHIQPPPLVEEPKPPVPPEPVPPPPPPPPPVPPPHITSIVRPIVEPPIPPGPIVPLIVPPPPKPVEPVPPPPPIVPLPPPKAPEPVPPPPPVPEKEEVKEGPPLPPEPPKFEIFLKDSSLIKGSKMALRFGTVFLTLMAQFFDNARATIDLMTNPPPVFKE